MGNVRFKKGTTVGSGYEAKDAQVLDGLVQGLLKCITKNRVKAMADGSVSSRRFSR